MYDPGVGRWLEQDPIGFSGGDPNLYRYVGNAPTNASDPSGLSRMEVQDLPDGRQGLYYVDTNWIAQAGSCASVYGWFTPGRHFESSPVFIGVYDPLTGNVQRGNNFVAYERVRETAESYFGRTPNWNAFFREHALPADVLGPPELRNNAFAAVERPLGGGNNPANGAVRARQDAAEVGLAAGLLAVDRIGLLRFGHPGRLLPTRGRGGGGAASTALARGAPIVRSQGGREILIGISDGAGGRLATRDAIPHMIEWLRGGGRRDVIVGSLEQAQRIRTALAPQAREVLRYVENNGTAIWQLHPAEAANPMPHIRLWDGRGGSFHIFFSQS
jgi:hypothetical protein